MIPGLIYLPVVLMGAAEARFRSPVDPFIVILAACAIVAAAAHAPRRGLGRRVA